jgi:hypothetical protein
MCHIKHRLLMASSMHPVNNVLKCSKCYDEFTNGSICNNSYYCTICYEYKLYLEERAQAQAQAQAQVQVQGLDHVPEREKARLQHFGKKSYAHSSSTPAASTVLQSNCSKGGTCANCNNTYKCSNNAVEHEDKWFCRIQCKNMHVSNTRAAQFHSQGTMFPFMSNMYTVFPLSVNSKTGKMTF